MITVFHILPGMGLVIGGLGGAALGSSLGTTPGIILGVLGGGVGWVCGRLPFFMVLKSIKRDFRGLATDRLRSLLRDPGFLAPNAVLLELGSRGKDIESEMPVVLDMLIAPSRERRMRGWHALESAFPARARMVGDYRIDDTPDQCRTKIRRLMVADLGAAQNDGTKDTLGNSGFGGGPPPVN